MRQGHPYRPNSQCVTCLVSMQALEELPGIVYRSLQHGAVHYHAEVMAADEWHDNGPRSCHGISVHSNRNCVRWLCKPTVSSAVQVSGLR
jgi:hypothetical protein